MGINWTNWLQAPLSTTHYSELLPAALEGYQAARMPKRIAQEEAQREAELAYKIAQAEKEKKYGGLNLLTGAAREYMSLEMLKNMYGEDNPLYQNAKKAYDLDLERISENIKSSEFYRKNPWRLYDPTTKQIHAESLAAQGKFPEGGQAYTPEQSQEAVDIYERERYEKSPAFLQQQALASAQIDKTIENINPEKAFIYSGVKGKLQLAKDRLEATKGNTPERLVEFEKQISKLHGLRTQLSTYLSTAAAQKAQADLDYLVNPSNWFNTPEIAKEKYKSIIDLYESERNVTQKAIKAGNPYGSSPIFASNQPAKANELSEAIEQRVRQEKAKSEAAPGGSNALVLVKTKRGLARVPLNELPGFKLHYPEAEIINSNSGVNNG